MTNLSEVSKRWLKAANKLGIDPTLNITCPECEKGELIVKDEIIEGWNKIDRYMICNTCGKYNVLTMGIPENYQRGLK